MYDEPPDPEPNPCPYCEAELGHGDDCAHCEAVRQLSEAQGALSSLKHSLGCRARWLCMTDPGAVLSPRFMDGVGVLLDLAGLPLPEHFVRHARAAMLGEYGEHVPHQRDERRLSSRVPDDDLVSRFMAMAHKASNAASAPYFAEVLDAKPATQADQLWWGDDENGIPRVWSGAEKRQGGRASSTQWGLTLRETIEKALDAEARSASFWMEFQREYLDPPKNLTPPEDPRFVRGGGQPKVSFVVGIEAYTAYVGKHKSENWSSRGLGFGGAEFLVRLDDGREFFTDNNWSRGTVPPHLRKLLRSNAVFVKAPAVAPVVEHATA
jgi:hypothetical protein